MPPRWKVRIYGETAVVHCVLDIHALVDGQPSLYRNHTPAQFIARLTNSSRCCSAIDDSRSPANCFLPPRVNSCARKLNLLVHDEFPALFRYPPESREVLRQLRYRHKLVKLRTMVAHTLHALVQFLMLDTPIFPCPGNSLFVVQVA